MSVRGRPPPLGHHAPCSLSPPGMRAHCGCSRHHTNYTQAALCGANVRILMILLGTAATSATGDTGLTQPQGGVWAAPRAAVVPVSLDRLILVAGFLPSNPEGVACPLQWLPLFLAGTPVPPTHRRLLGHTFTTKGALKTAVKTYNANPTAAVAMYGPIANWDVSAITDMSNLYYNLQNFNADISNWDTSSVTTMSWMFGVRSARALAPTALSRALPAHADCVAATPHYRHTADRCSTSRSALTRPAS